MLFNIEFTNKFFTEFLKTLNKSELENFQKDIEFYIINNYLSNKKRILSFDNNIKIHKLEIRNKPNTSREKWWRLLSFIILAESDKIFRIIPVLMYDVNEEKSQNKKNSDSSYWETLRNLLIQWLNSWLKVIIKYQYKNWKLEKY